MHINRISARRMAKGILAASVALTMFTSATIVQVAAAERDAISQPAATAQTGPLPAGGAGGIQAAQGTDLDDQTLILVVGGTVILILAVVLLTQGNEQSTVSTTSTN